MNPLASGSQSILFQKFKGYFSFLVPKNHKIFYAMVPGVNFNIWISLFA